MKKTIFIFLMIFGFWSLNAQLEAAHWYFGDNAGLNFMTQPTSNDLNGQLSTIEGCSSISDSNGNLLLYTDGITVFNHNHTVMSNGTGLMGNSSSSQSGLIVPHPGQSNIYYIITVDDDNNDNGLRYSVADMGLNGGLGGILPGQKNILLISNIKEKVTAIANLDHNFVWVVTLGPAPRNANPTIPVQTYNSPYNTIYAIKIDNSGLNGSSQVVYTTFNGQLHVNQTHGYIKISTRGDKLAIANYYDMTLYLLDFDINTGSASNLRQLALPSNYGPYGVEFSPNGNFLYVYGATNPNGGGDTAMLLQYDLTQTNIPYTIIHSEQGYRGALQLGIDGKIYIAESNSYSLGRDYVSTIDNPNNAGAACNYHNRAISLSPRYSRQGLPQFIQSFFVQIETQNVCEGEQAHFTVHSNLDIDHVDWDFGDGNNATTTPDPGDLKTAEADHTYATAGNYHVTATIYTTTNNHTTTATNIEIYPLPTLPNPDPQLEECDINQNGITDFSLHSNDSNIIGNQPYQGIYSVHYYETLTDAQNETNELSDPYTNTTPYNQDIYSVLKNEDTGCSSIGTLHLIVHPLPQIFTIPDLETCDDNDDGLASFTLADAEPDILNGRNASDYTIAFYETQSDAENGTNPLSDPYTNTTPGQQTIYYSITDNQTGCVNYGTFDLIVHPKPEIVMDDEYIVCAGGDITIDAPAGFVAYDWSTGDTTQSITVTQGGDYTVTVTDNFGCTNSKTVHVRESDAANIDNIVTVDFNGDNNSITVYVSGPGDYEYSLDGINYQDSNTFEGLSPGTYTVYVQDKNGCGVTTEIVYLLGAPKYFSPNGDGINEYWQIINVDKFPGTEIRIYDRYGRLMAEFTGNDPGWDGTYNGVPQPSTDYWYIAEMPQAHGGKTVKGHFSLIR